MRADKPQRPRRSQRLDRRQLIAGFEVSINCRFWVSTEADAIVIIKGGALTEKIAAVEAFWAPDGARILISTSAGGEGINLQCARLLFNYDLPWNPMAVEQRIGRIHRYGQEETVQVYNLVAEDTVEERIYGILEQKLREIAQAIGKIDPGTGDVVEDFRTEVLGFLGSSPNYQDLFKRALVDRDYVRTEREMAEAMQRARRASDALRSLAQNLDGFNLAKYTALRGRLTIDDLKQFCLAAIPHLGGAILPDAEFYRVEVPSCLLDRRLVQPSYRNVTFDRRLAMRRRHATLLGLGHPLIDALVDELQRDYRRGGTTAVSGDSTEPTILALAHARIRNQDGRPRTTTRAFELRHDGSWQALERPEPQLVRWLDVAESAHGPTWPPDATAATAFRAAAKAWEAELRSTADDVLSVQVRLTGLARLS